MQDTERIIIVHLRPPRMTDPNEARTDPFYEFGSFGLTGCHDRNLLSDVSAAGSRLAFAQPGDAGVRLVLLTPPIEIARHSLCNEARWSPAEMPLRYHDAPLIIDNLGRSEIAGLTQAIARTNRPTWLTRFASRFRTRKTPVDQHLAKSIERVWEGAVGRSVNRAEHYWEALPEPPPSPDDRRRKTYEALFRAANGLPEMRSCTTACKPRKTAAEPPGKKRC